MKSLKFGIEIETVTLGRQAVANAVQSVVGGNVRYVGGGYDVWEVVDGGGCIWKAMSDGSLRSPNGQHAEVVSPILEYGDIERMQEVVRALRHAGAQVNDSTGIHIHVDASLFDAKAIANLVKTVHKQERLIEYALGIDPRRRERYCRSVDASFIQGLERRRPRTLEQLNTLWYGRYNAAPIHYDGTRYHGVNLHNVWYRGTIEFRWFDATLHAGKVKAYVQFVLALAARALGAKATSSRRREFNAATAKYDFRVFLISALKLNGAEFKTCRTHLLARLEGSAAWKHGRPIQPAQEALPTATAEVAA